MATAVAGLSLLGLLLIAQSVLQIGDSAPTSAASGPAIDPAPTGIPSTIGTVGQNLPATAQAAPTVVQSAAGRDTGLDSPGFVPLKPDSGNEDWRLTFDDEFNGTSLDTSKWTTHFWWGRTRDVELQYYSDDAVEVGDGRLTLRAEKRSEGGRNYTSGVVTTLGSFSQKYGFWEVRGKVPAGEGLWPAVWMMTDAGNRTIWPPEIDLVEFRGGQPNVAHMNYHYSNESTGHGQASMGYEGPDFSAGFHTYGIQWAPDSLTWYVDGVARYRVRTDVPTAPMYLIVDLAVGDWGGRPNASTPFPSRFEVDYVRVWQSDPYSSPEGR